MLTEIGGGGGVAKRNGNGALVPSVSPSLPPPPHPVTPTTHTHTHTAPVAGGRAPAAGAHLAGGRLQRSGGLGRGRWALFLGPCFPCVCVAFGRALGQRSDSDAAGRSCLSHPHRLHHPSPPARVCVHTRSCTRIFAPTHTPARTHAPARPRPRAHRQQATTAAHGLRRPWRARCWRKTGGWSTSSPCSSCSWRRRKVGRAWGGG